MSSRVAQIPTALAARLYPTRPYPKILALVRLHIRPTVRSRIRSTSALGNLITSVWRKHSKSIARAPQMAVLIKKEDHVEGLVVKSVAQVVENDAAV